MYKEPSARLGENGTLCISSRLFLDTLKVVIRGKTISYSSFKKRLENNREQELVNKIEGSEKEIEHDSTRIGELNLLKK